MALRAYQETPLEAARQRFRIGKRRVLLVAPTGAGKTIMFSAMVLGHIARGGYVLIVVHRRELLEQAKAKLILAGVDPSDIGLILAGQSRNPSARVQIASIQTLINLDRRELPAATLVVFDEAHHFVAAEWGGVAAHYKDSLFVGVTATPERGDGTPLGDLFEEMVVVTSVRVLTEDGHLVPCRVIAPAKARKSDARDPLDAYREHAFGRPGVIFCATVKDARELAERFVSAGISAACVDGETDSGERAASLAAFERREISILTNVYCLTEGWDAPIAEVCILARGCSHAGTFLQMVGRILRPAPGKTDALLIDLRGVVHKHGLPDEDRMYSLEGKAIGRGPTRTCPECDAKIAAACTECPLCGFVFPVGCGRAEQHAEEQEKLSRVDRLTLERSFFISALEEAKHRGFKPGWVVHRFEQKFGRKPWGLWKEFFPKPVVGASYTDHLARSLRYRRTGGAA